MSTGQYKFVRDPAVLYEAGEISGAKWATAYSAGNRYDRDNVAVMLWEKGTAVSVLTPANTFPAAPVEVVRARTEKGMKLFDKADGGAVIEAGNANAGTGRTGEDVAISHCASVAKACEVANEDILPFATGIIGGVPDHNALSDCAAALHNTLGGSPKHWAAAARTIQTTDTFAKMGSVSVYLPVLAETVLISGICKGAAMIHPNMATMLGFIATDANLALETLHHLNRSAADASFNRITIDKDSSTNDCVLLAATGRSSAVCAEADIQAFADGLRALYFHLAACIVEDAEGCDRVMHVRVTGGADDSHCAAIAREIAGSILLKTVLTASDPNWGRILMAAGNAGVKTDPDKVSLWLGKYQVVQSGEIVPQYRDEQGLEVFQSPCVAIHLDLGMGECESFAMGCELTQEYVRLNSEYRT